MQYIINWLLITVAVFVSAELIPGVMVKNFFTAFVVAVVMGVINTFIKPILLVLTLPINVFTLGIFTLVINAGLVMLVAYFVEGFSVRGFWQALLFSIILSLVNSVLHYIGRD